MIATHENLVLNLAPQTFSIFRQKHSVTKTLELVLIELIAA